jgi:phenylalanyl-tRNA synthetase beta chain
MPVVSIYLDTLFRLVGIDPIPNEELRKLMQRFGLELEDIAEDKGRTSAKVEVPANRPDLLSVESISIALKVYLGGAHPQYTVVPGPIEFTFDDTVAKIRPILISGVLRNIHFNQESYESFIDLQEKLHQNLCRRRTLASIGTHDLGKCRPPFIYLAEPPEKIVFVPLTGGAAVNGHELFENLRKHQQLSKYLYLLDDQPLWPVIRDADGEVCSLPPIINSDKTRIDLTTTDVFIDCTALDHTRALTAVVCLCAAFSLYSTTPFVVEQVKIIRNGEVTLSPTFDYTEFTVEVEGIRSLCGLHSLPVDTIVDLLGKMMLRADPLPGGTQLRVVAPPTRSDILHACDIAEDVAIGYGYDRIAAELTHPIPAGRPLSINELSDRIRREVVGCGWNEILNFSLCATKDCFDLLGLPRDDNVVRLRNAKTVDYEIVRTTLLPGLLRVTKNIFDHPNTKNTRPLRLFEISDVVLLDPTTDTNARNERRFCATIADTKSTFQEVHGLLDRFFEVNGRVAGYKLVREDLPTCIPGQRAAVLFEGKPIGWIGVIHPLVLTNFELTTPVVAFEVQVEPFMAKP